MGDVTDPTPGTRDASQRPVSRRASFGWLGVVPFFVFATAFLFLPVAFLVIGSFQRSDGSLTAR